MNHDHTPTDGPGTQLAAIILAQIKSLAVDHISVSTEAIVRSVLRDKTKHVNFPEVPSVKSLIHIANRHRLCYKRRMEQETAIALGMWNITWLLIIYSTTLTF